MNLSIKERQEYEAEFKILYMKIQKSDLKLIRILNNEEQDKIEIIINAIEIETLLEWAKIVIQDIKKDEVIKILKKKSEKKGWIFGLWKGKSEENTEIKNEEDEIKQMKELNEFFQDSVEDVKLDFSSIQSQGYIKNYILY